MPDMSGYEVLTLLKANPVTRDIPVIFVTAMSATEDEEHGLELGAVDYITKPLRAAIVLARVRTHLTLKRASDFLRDQNAFLEAEVVRRMAENQAHPGCQHPCAGAPGRDPRPRDRQPHSPHPELCRRAGAGPAPAFPLLRPIDGAHLQLLTKSAPLHDIGKVGNLGQRCGSS